MHILIVIAAGLIALAAFYFGAQLLGAGGAAGASLFVWTWLVVAIVNGVFGVVWAGIPIINEIGAFIPIFGIPSVVAWYLIRRSSAR